jgi:hypothetical protein
MEKKLDTEIPKRPPIRTKSGRILQPDEARQLLKGSINAPQRAQGLEQANKRLLSDEEKQVLQELKFATRSGQMTLQEWGSLRGVGAGAEAILCELTPNYIRPEQTTYGDILETVFIAIREAIAKDHPQAEVLSKAQQEFYDQEIEDCSHVLYKWDKALGATAKYLISPIDRVEFWKLRKAQGKDTRYSLREYIDWLEEWKKQQSKKSSGGKSNKPPSHIPNHTSMESRVATTALCDAGTLKDWRSDVDSELMIHSQGPDLEVLVKMCDLPLSWWETPRGAHLEILKEEIQKIDIDTIMTFRLCLGWAAQEGQVETSIDCIIEAIGRGADARRSRGEREKWRLKVWHWLLLFHSLYVDGMRPGIYREPGSGGKNGEKIPPSKLRSKDALIKIIGQRDEEQSSLDNSTPPLEVTFVAGPWVKKFQGNREVLTVLGDIRSITAIPRGKPSGIWAATVGLALLQGWREAAHRTPVTYIEEGNSKIATLAFQSFTRRTLLTKPFRSDVDPYEILRSDTPHRAKEYWDAAIKTLRKHEIIGTYREVRPLSGERRGWQEEWLSQPLDIRPVGKNLEDVIAISESANLKRTRKGKKSHLKV